MSQQQYDVTDVMADEPAGSAGATAFGHVRDWVALNEMLAEIYSALESVGGQTLEQGITASTTQTQGQGQLTANVSIVATVANDDDTVTGVSGASVNSTMIVFNRGANRLQLFPDTGEDLGIGANEPIYIGPLDFAVFRKISSTAWELISGTVTTVLEGAPAVLTGGVNRKTVGWHDGVENAKDRGARANETYDNKGVGQALVDALEAAEGGKIVFPVSGEGGRYRFTSGLVNDSAVPVSFAGTAGMPRTNAGTAGWQSTLWLDSDDDDAFLIKYAGPAEPRAAGMRVCDLGFIGNNDTDGLGANQSAVVFAGRCGLHHLARCGFTFFSGYAVAHDPTVLHSYNQNSAMRDCGFWNVGGVFGPTAEYTDDPGDYLFANQYTFDNINLDNGLGWGGWGHTAKPYIFDLRAIISSYFNSQLLTEGGGESCTAILAVASGGTVDVEFMWSEWSSGGPTYLLMSLNNDFDKWNSGGERIIKIRRLRSGGLEPVYFQQNTGANQNEVIVEVEDWGSYASGGITVGHLAEWENGVAANPVGRLIIKRLNTKVPLVIPPEYAGRLVVEQTIPRDQTPQLLLPTGVPRRLFSWDPSKGSFIRDWGAIVATQPGSTANSVRKIEADGNDLVERHIGSSSDSNKFPAPILTFRGAQWQGAFVTFVAEYKVVIDPADDGVTTRMWRNNPDHWDELAIVNSGDVNTSAYTRLVGSGRFGTAGTNYQTQWTADLGGSLTEGAELRLRSFEVWLGTPDHFATDAAPIPIVPTFGATDATPSVSGFKTWKTGTSSLTITDLDDFPAGEERTIISKGSITFDMTGGNLAGSSADLVTADGDITRWVSEDGTTKRLVGFVDASADNSGGA